MQFQCTNLPESLALCAPVFTFFVDQHDAMEYLI